ncbi:MAG TPA: tetratricopeptide repeat protein [Burkholderiales bacterium]|nr:tetratricopeptide repeat protein [Burkholderiales bacterium]
MPVLLLVLIASGGARAETAAPPQAAQQLMAEGRAAIIREDYAAAIRVFTRLLALPESSLTRDAQEFLGLSYERSGDIARARQQYENYLKRYPEGEDATRVRQRLASLPSAAPPPREALRAPTQPVQGPRLMTFGSLSQFYYHGKSRIDTQPVTANAFDRSTLSLTDQSALYTNVDLNARLLTDTHDNRIVFRDTDLRNFLAGQDSQNRLMAAYYDYRYKPADVSARVGRQPGYSGGVIGRFDGALLGYGIAPRMRLNAVAGEPVQLSGFETSSRQSFYGVNADLGPFNERWTANLYLIRQSVDGIADREANGVELRYLAPQATFISLLDYDTLFHETNIAMAQGSWQSPLKTTLNFFFDRRKTPTLETATAALGQPNTSIRDLVNTFSAEELRRQARALTATVTTASAGFTQPVSPRWQLGGDYRVMHVSSTEGSGNVPPMPDTGHVRTASGQAIGTGLFSRRDVTALTVSRITADAYHGAAFSFNTRAPIGDTWALGSSFLWYGQHNANGSTSQRLFATLRAEYRWRTSVALEGEAGIDNTHSKGQFADERFNRGFFSLGYRWDF